MSEVYVSFLKFFGRRNETIGVQGLKYSIFVTGLRPAGFFKQEQFKWILAPQEHCSYQIDEKNVIHALLITLIKALCFSNTTRTAIVVKHDLVVGCNVCVKALIA